MRRTLYYKAIRFHNDTSDRTLQQLLAAATRKLKFAKDRIHKEEEGDHTLLNFTGKNKGVQVGELLVYQPGGVQPLAKLTDKKETLELLPLEPQKNTEFVQSTLYFVVSDDHMIVAKGRGLGFRQLENYLIWLFRTAGLFTEDQFLAVMDQPPRSIGGRRITSATGINLSAPISFQGSDDDQLSDKKKESGVSKIVLKPFGLGWEALQGILPDALKLPDELKATDIASGRDLRVKLQLSWNRPRKEDPTTLLDNICHELRHITDELDYEIETPSGTIKNGMLKLKKAVTFELNASRLPNRASIWDKMREYLVELRDERKIDL